MEAQMSESVYKVIELVGTSTDSWEKAAKAAVDRAAKSLRDLRVAEVIEQDMVLDNGKVTAYRAKVKVSFKYEGQSLSREPRRVPAWRRHAARYAATRESWTGLADVHTLMVLAGGFILLALMLLGGRLLGLTIGKAAIAFVPLWLVAALANMWVGVTRAGYSIASEFPIFLVVFAVPAVVALLLRSRA
jgi:flavin-binding protein dodecin